MNFREKWLEAVKTKNSVLCAGLDPADHEMGRGEKGLPFGVDKLAFSLDYIDAVASFAPAVKPNLQYWRGIGDIAAQKAVVDQIHARGSVAILDAKLADIGSTNDAGFFYTAQVGFDAVTVAPYAGNLIQAGEQAKNYELGAIAMCLMSNPEYETEKDKLVPITREEIMDYAPADIVFVGGVPEGVPHVRQYIYLASVVANNSGLEGVVIGAPSEKNHIEERELERARWYAGPDSLVLMPGVGAQGGEAEAIWKFFDPEMVIVNVGRDLMFPKDRTIAEQAEHYRNMLNALRG